MIRCWCLLLFLLPQLLFALPAALKFKHIGSAQGLSSNSIETIYQDKRGFMWFGTNDGLNRYDGYKMVVYKHKPGDRRSLSNNFVHAIFEDHKGRMWIATSDGLNVFNPHSNNFTSFKHKSKYTAINGDAILSIYEDSYHNLWVGTDWGSLSLVNVEKGTFQDFYTSGRLGNPGSYSLNSLCQGYTADELLIGANNGLKVFNVKTKRFQSTTVRFKRTVDFSVAVILTDKSKNIWLGTDGDGVVMMDKTGTVFKQFKKVENSSTGISSNRILSILINKKGFIYFGTVNGGLSQYNPQTKSFLAYTNNPSDRESLSQRTISALFEDRENNLWVGTRRGGVNQYSPHTKKFELYQTTSSANSLSYNDVRAFFEDKKGLIWVGTDGGGLNSFDKNTNIFKHYRHSPSNSQSIGSNEIFSILEDSKGEFWIGTFDGGLNRFDRQQGVFKKYLNNPADKYSISSNLVEQVYEDSDHNLWVCTYSGGLCRFDRKTEQFTRVGIGKSPETSLEGIKTISVNEDRKRNLWIVTVDAGLSCYNKVTGKFKHYFNNAQHPDLVLTFIDSRGRIWVGKRGLYLFDEKKQDFVLFNTSSGLNNEHITGILEGKPGELWISSSKGLTKLNVKDRTFRRFNLNDGLQGLEFEANSCLKTRNGEMYFGGVNGFNRFHPDSIKLNNFVPNVFITGFKIFDKVVEPGENSVLKSDITSTQKIDLEYDQSSITFEYLALSYSDPDNNQYTYKLEGFDNGWSPVSNRHSASYTNLDPGEYIFKVKASNNDNIWNPSERTVTIRIFPPLWATWWAILIYIIIAGTLLYLFFEFRKKLALKEMEEAKKEELHQVQLQFFTNISHEFRTPLTLILGPTESLKQDDPRPNTLEQYNTIQRNAIRLMRLVNELMDFRKVESGVLKLNVSPHSSCELLSEIAQEFKQLAHQKSIEFTIRYPEQEKVLWIDMDVVEKITFNLLNNAFKYTNEGGSVELGLYFSISDIQPSFLNEFVIKNKFVAQDYFFLKVKDNGQGVSKDSLSQLFERYYRVGSDRLGSGIGLAFVKSLVELHKGEIYVYSERLKGAEFIVALPLSEINYLPDERFSGDTEVQKVRLESIVPIKDELVMDLSDDLDIVGADAGELHEEHVLIVEDNPELRAFLKTSLSRYYQVHEAENGMQGIEMVQEYSPDLIITDVMMPVMDGLEFCRAIRNDIETSHIPLIMLTAKNSLDAQLEGINSGADIYISKPFSVALLLSTIKNIFDQQNKLKSYYSKNHYAEVKELVHTTKDREFMEKLVTIIESHLIDAELDVDFLAREIGMSKSTLYKKIKPITGQSIIEFIRSFRLKKAVQIMTEEDVPLGDVVFRVGIQSQSYFTKAFKKEYGKTPSQFMQEIRGKG